MWGNIKSAINFQPYRSNKFMNHSWSLYGNYMFKEKEDDILSQHE